MLYKKGDKVIVYEDPITERKKEDEAIVLQHLKTFASNNGCNRYQVKFPDGTIAERWIKEI